MKKLIILLFICVTANISAQNNDEKLIGKITKQACKAINKANITEKDSPDEVKVKLGLALLPALQDNREEIRNVWGYDISNPDDARAVGEKIGAQLVYNCPEFQQITMRLLKTDTELQSQVSEAMKAPGEAPPASVTGTISRIEGSELNAVYVNTSGDETVKLFWIEKIEGSELLENWTAGQNRNFVFTYGLRTIYQPKQQAYQEVKVLISVSEKK